MKLEEIQEIVSILPEDRTLFYYFKDRYALMLLEHLYDSSINISEMKQSRLAGMLNKDVLKPLVKQAGNGKLTMEQIQALWPVSTKVFSLTLGQWGHDDWGMQTTRNECNLVLQLNFSNQHREKYLDLLRPSDEVWINDVDHPVHDISKKFQRDTLAWARLDIDLTTGEALIEEIQCDFIRDVKYIYSRLQQDPEAGSTYGIHASQRSMNIYYEEVLSEYIKIWDEAMLAATIDFLVRELGIKHVYYHSWETGLKVKRMCCSRPPKSLYTKLPRRFYFEQTEQAPEFLYKDKNFRRLAKSLSKTPNKLQWYKLPLCAA